MEFWAKLVVYSIVLSSMDFFKRMFGLMRSLLILYVHEHDHLGFGMLTVERAVIRKQKCKLLRTLLVSRKPGEILRSVA